MKKLHSIEELTAEFVHQADKGFCVKNLKGANVWLPKSQVEIESTNPEPGMIVSFQCLEWLAKDKELI